VALALVATLSSPARAQTPPPAPEADHADPADLVNTLLSGLLGFRDVSEPELQQEVAEVGGVAFKAEVGVEYLSHEQLARYLTEMFDSEYPVADAEADRRTLVALDLMPAATDLRRLRARVLEDNVVGFYDERPSRRRLCVVSGDHRLTPMNQLVLAHELRHALQDQYLNIHGLLPDSIGDYDDRRLAMMSMLEGDATFVMERFLMGRLGAGAAGLEAEGGGSSLFGLGAAAAAQIPDAPAVVRDQLVLPYFAGRDFIESAYEDGGWEAVKAVWARPPISTEQVLHPEKYKAREGPRAVELPGPPAGGLLLREGVLGEALLRTLLGEGSEGASAGWGGDAYRVFDLSGRTLLVWRAVWDTPAGLRGFLTALQARFRRAYGPPTPRLGYSLYGTGPWRFAVGERAGGAELVSSDDSSSLDTFLRSRSAGAPPAMVAKPALPVP
jgi:hypothetical protein